MRRNDPQVLVELMARFSAYEQALRDNDLALLASFFDDSEDLVRFGIADRQRGAAALAAWRAVQPPIPSERTLDDTIVTSFGPDVGVVSTLFSYPGGRCWVARARFGFGSREHGKSPTRTSRRSHTDRSPIIPR